jgi:hypothetical protein
MVAGLASALACGTEAAKTSSSDDGGIERSDGSAFPSLDAGASLDASDASDTMSAVDATTLDAGSTAGGGVLPLLDGSIYLGAFVNPGDGATPAALAAFEANVGRTMALSMHYAGWSTAFPSADEMDDASKGRVPVISWNCAYPNAMVASVLSAALGDPAQDIDGIYANVSARADAIKSYGRPIFLRFFWEMNLTKNSNGRTACYDPATDKPNGVFDPGHFVDAWRALRQVFAARGVRNVIWLWNPSGDPDGTPDPGPYYPGPDQVDWVGIDQYDRADASFGDTFALYAPLSAYAKPILIAETGALPGNQAAFLGAAPASLQASFPLVNGLMYFDSAGAIDWRLDDAGLTAFKALGASPYLSAIP